MFLREKPTYLSRITRTDWNWLMRFLQKFKMVRGGQGIEVRSLPGGLTISAKRGELGIPEFALARIMTEGPDGEYDFDWEEPDAVHENVLACHYWVREVRAGAPIYRAIPGQQRPWAEVPGFDYVAGGFWEPAINLAEVGLPKNCRHTLVLPYERAIPVDPDVDDTPEGDVTDEDDLQCLEMPVVTTWKTKMIEGTSFRAFSLFRPRLVEEYFMQTYDLDGVDCPDPYQWKKRISLRLHEEDGTP